MLELANTRITIGRGTGVNDAGDVTDVGTPLYLHVPAAVVEKSHQTFDFASSTRRTVRTIMCVVPHWTDVLTTDTIQDERTGNFYGIEDIQRQPTLNIPGTVILTLRSLSGTSWGSDGSPADG